MVNYKCLVIGKQVSAILFIKQATITIIQPFKKTHNFSFKRLQHKNEFGDPHFFIIELWEAW